MIEVHTPTYNETNERARSRFFKIVDKHLEALKVAFDEYMNTDDQEKNPARDLELEQYLYRVTGGIPNKYALVKQAICEAYPKPPKPAPVFVGTVGAPIVKSEKEARKKSYHAYTIITEPPQVDVPEALKDPNIQWTGHSVTEIEPTLTDRNNPARMTYEGEVYYRNEE